MTNRWSDVIKDYPPNLVIFLWLDVKKYASEWISLNAPEAWFRPMFDYSEAQLNSMFNQIN